MNSKYYPPLGFNLIKYFGKKEYAESFIKGTIFSNSLHSFRKFERQPITEPVTKFQNDIYEGSTLIHKNSLDLDIVKNLERVFPRIPNDPFFIFDEFKYSHLLCCSTIDHVEYGVQTTPIENMKEFGEYAVIIHDRIAFQERIGNILSKHSDLFYVFGKVKYFSPTLNGRLSSSPMSLGLGIADELFDFNLIRTPNIKIRDCLNKSKKYEHQREWRLWIYKNKWNIDPFVFEIGDLSDITTLIHVDNYEIEIKKLAFQNKLLFYPEQARGLSGNIQLGQLTNLIIENNPLGSFFFNVEISSFQDIPKVFKLL